MNKYEKKKDWGLWLMSLNCFQPLLLESIQK